MIYPPPSAHSYFARHELNARSKYQEVDIYALDAPQLLQLWISIKEADGLSKDQIVHKLNELGLELTTTTLALARDYLSEARGGLVLAALAKDLSRSGNIFSQYYIAQRNGKEYVVFKGNQRLRQIITGTRYLASNTKLMKLGIGGKALQATAKSGVVISLFFSSILHSVRWIFEDDYRWTHWITHLSVDATKIAIAGVSGYLASIATAGAFLALTSTAPVILPIAAGLFVCLAVGAALAMKDDETVTKQIIKTLETVEHELRNIDRTLKDGVFYVIDSSKKYVVHETRRVFMSKLRTLLQKLGPACF